MMKPFRSKKFTICGKGRVEKNAGLTLLYLKGSHYEMGYQHGTLLKTECKQNLRATMDLARKQKVDFTILQNTWKTMKEYVPNNYLKEMEGLSDALEMSIDDIGLIWIIGEYLYNSCCGVSIWGNATKNKKLYHWRSYDVSYSAKDPITTKNIQDNSILIIAQPEKGYAFMYPTMAGFVCHGGINEKGLAISYTWSWNNDGTLNGIPVVLRLNRALAYSSSAQEAITLLNKDKTSGFNFLISDGNTPVGYILEQTAHLSIINEWNSPNEFNYPFWSIKNCVRRTNFFINPETAKTQRSKYEPNGIINFINMFTRQQYLGDVLPIYISWNHYKTLSKEIEKKFGEVNLENSMLMLRDIYQGNTNIFLAFSQKISKKRYKPMYQWVACPETGDMLLSFSDSKHSAEWNKIHHYNLFDLLKFKNE